MPGRGPDVVADDVEQFSHLDMRLPDVARHRDRERAVDAVAVERGLLVPVIRDVDKKGILQLTADLAERSELARQGKLKPADMQGGCMTISSLGGIGGTAFTPIVNAPEVAILGVTRAKMQPVWNGSSFEPKLMLPLDITYDHRVIDGAEGARFMEALKNYLGDVRRLLL